MTEDNFIYRNILGNMSGGVMTIDLEGRIITFNGAAESILGLKQSEVLRRSFAEVFLQRDGNDEFNQTILNAVYESATIHNSIIPYNTGRKTLLLSVTSSLLRSSDDGQAKDVAVIIVFDDVTEMQRLRNSEIALTEELKAHHKELQNSYLELEDTNVNLQAALKKVQLVRIASTIFVLLLFLGIGIFSWKNAGSVSGTAREAPQAKADGTAAVRTHTVSPRTLSDSIYIKGFLKPIKIVNITSPLGGTVKERLFEYGQTVTKGQLLARMDPSETEVKYRDAKAAYMKAAEKMRELNNWENGDEMTKAKRSVSKSRMTLDSQKKTAEETEILFKKGIVPSTEYQNAKQQYVNVQLDYESALQEQNAVKAKGGADHVAIAKLELDNASQKLRDLENQLKQAEIIAPVSGTILLPESSGEKEKKTKAIEKGTALTQGEILLSIGDTEGLAVTASVDEMEVLKIRQGQEVKIVGDAFPGMSLKGRVSYISSQAGATEGMKKTAVFEVNVAIDKLSEIESRKVRLGMSCSMEILILNRPDVLLVPIGAVRIEGQNRYVTLLDPKTRTQQKIPVETGITTIDSVEIVTGLRAGNEIVLP